jgi:Mg/Co/Ni transporter MgtE
MMMLPTLSPSLTKRAAGDIRDIDQEDASSIRALLTYDEDTAGGLMNSELLSR